MGVYDEIRTACPSCNKDYWVQSKSGECELNEYDLKTVPEDVLEDANRHAPYECDCGAVFEVKGRTTVECKMRERKDHLGLNNHAKT